VTVLDGSWHLAGRDAAAEYRAGHIPGAIFFDIDAVADTANPLPHMLPTPERFADMVEALGIGDGDRIVVYDSVGLGSAARVWWTFRVMGAENVAILEGGLPKWIAEGRPLSTSPVVRSPRSFRVRFDPGAVVGLAEVRANIGSAAFQLVDGRPAGRWQGSAPEPRHWVKSGHVPQSFNVPSGELIADGRLKEPEALRKAFLDAGVDLDRPIATSCGSGVNAATLSLALDVIGVRTSALYDGSWTEWGARDDTPIATGPER
jgi:thiosulfate/3-mercaptopyruvate sulfurtransferase